jgi:hypothetical protein
MYQLVLVWDALRLKNTIQIIGLCILNIGLLVYGALQIDQVQQALDQLFDSLSNKDAWNEVRGPMTAIPIVLGVVTLIMSFVAWRLYDEFAWTIYKHISADLRMKRRYLTYQVGGNSTPRSVYNNLRFADLYCIAQIRFLFLPRLHNPVSRHRARHRTR